LGIALAFRVGCFNMGADGQVYLGGLAASVILLQPGFQDDAAACALLVLAALGAVLAGGLMGGLCGFLKRRFGANELISTFLLSAALTPFADYCISGPLRNPAANLLATARFAPNRLLPKLLPPSCLSISFLLAIVLVLLGRVFLYRTVWGYRIRVAGAAPAFARYGGIDASHYWTPAMAASGALNGLAGFFAVAGTYGLCNLGFSGGLGWNAIAVSLIARNRPLALFPAALIYGALKAGSDSALLARGLSFETSAFIQAVVLILATVHFAAPLVIKRKQHEQHH
jgi:simple sugar transport system permease protein